MTPALDGAWTVETSLHDPGEWIVELIAIDDEQQVSERILIELIICIKIHIVKTQDLFYTMGI